MREDDVRRAAGLAFDFSGILDSYSRFMVFGSVCYFVTSDGFVVGTLPGFENVDDGYYKFENDKVVFKGELIMYDSVKIDKVDSKGDRS